MRKQVDPKNFQECVNHAMTLLKEREAQMIDEGYQWPFDTGSCRWGCEQKIINRPTGTGMLSAAISYVEKKEKEAEFFNGI